jgi:ribosomal protein L32
VADIFRAHGEAYRKTHALTSQQRKVMRAIETCRTAVLGGHLDVCPNCGESTPSYNSCRNRHCPKCQALKQAKWIAERQTRILPTHHFHVVFTVPDLLHPLARANPARFYALLFEAASGTLLDLGRDPKHLGALLGITCVLHTWTRDLRLHPHVHCVVTGGGLSPERDRWVRAGRRYLFPVKALSRLFRGKLMAAIAAAWVKGELTCADLAEPSAFAHLKNALYMREWVAYAKRPFGGPAQVFNYLGRYTHRVAISNQRLLSLDGEVRFITRGEKVAALPAETFVGRFLQHVLPDGFVKIRHFGLLAAGNVNTRLAAAQRLLAQKRPPLPKLLLPALALLLAACRPAAHALEWQARLFLLTGIDSARCRRCGAVLLHQPLPRPPTIRDSS